MSSKKIHQELQKVHTSLKALEVSLPIGIETSTSAEALKLSIKQAFNKDRVFCAEYDKDSLTSDCGS